MSITGDKNEAIQSRIQETSDDTGGLSPRIVAADQRDAKLVKIRHPGEVYSIAFLAGGKEVVSGGRDMKLRRWRAEDGMEVGMSLDTSGSSVWGLVVSQDGKWVVAGMQSGQVIVWNSTSFDEKPNKFKAHDLKVEALDISPDTAGIGVKKGC